MDRLSFEHCYLINLFNVSVEKFVSNSPSTPGESKRNQIRNKLKNYLYNLSIPEAGETAETPVKRYRNTGRVPIRTQKRPYPVRNYYFLLGYIHVFDKGNSVLGGN